MKQVLFKIANYLVGKLNCADDFSKLEGIDMKNYDGDEKRFKRLKKALLLLPDNVLESLKNNQVTIIYSKNAKNVYDGKYSGFYVPSEQLIYIWDSGNRSIYWQVITILHEVGHFVDFTLGGGQGFKSCIDVDFHEICIDEQKYYNKFTTKEGNYYTSNIKEYFAQSFAEYFLVPGFKTRCPETTKYIDSLLSSDKWSVKTAQQKIA